MKAGDLALAAALAAGVAANKHLAARHFAHAPFHQRGYPVAGVPPLAPYPTGTGTTTGTTTGNTYAPQETCECKVTIYSTFTGEGVLYFPPTPTSYAANSTTSISEATPTTYAANSITSVSEATPTTYAANSITSISKATPTTYLGPVVPTPLVTTCPTPGVYTVPAKTVTLNESTTVCGATSTYVPVGIHTAGGVTTVVKNATTVICPYATVSTCSGVTTSTILTTTYFCPKAGTYTIAPLTTTVHQDALWVYPTPAAYAPGIYTQPEVVTTVNQTNYVVLCPYTSSAPNSTYAATVAQSTSTYEAPVVKTTSTYEAPIVKTAPTYEAPVVKTTSTYEAPIVKTAPTYEAPVVKTTSTYEAPVVKSSSTHEAPVVKTAPTYEAPVVKSSSTHEAPLVPPTSTYVVPVMPTYSPAKTSKAKPSTTPYATTPSGKLGTSGKQWAITYSPYQDNGQCKDSGSVASDIAIIAKAGFTTVRVYSSDCSGLQNIGSACETHGLKMILGVFISSTGISGASEQLTDIVSWGKWNLVELFVVGNEAVFSGHCSAAELAAFIATCRTALIAGGYPGLITTTETLDIWEKNAAVLCPVVDIVGCNIHPFFNAAIDAEHAGEFTASQLKIVDGLCPGKYGVNLETGWPAHGSCNGLACPSPENQATAVKSISDAVGGKSVMFSYVNDYWKEPGAFGCEQSWGSIQNFQ
ncbi:unnamed protein product [Diplocarpon coronariae]